MNTTFFQHNQALFQVAKACLEDACKVKANKLEDLTGTKSTDQTAFVNSISHNPYKQAELCCMAMDNILTHVAEYDATACISRDVQKHAIQMLRGVPHPDAIFGLLEDLALITRGHTLVAHKSNNAEQTFLYAFENAGEWHAGDGKVVSDWYWLRLPAFAMAHESQVCPHEK